MKKILVTGSGGSPSTNFVRSLRKSPEKFYIVGIDAAKFSLVRSETDEKHLGLPADHEDYIDVLNDIILETGVEFVHAQPDQEVSVLSKNQSKIKANLFLPKNETVEILQDKWRSYSLWKKANIRVPETFIIKNENDLKNAFEVLDGNVWLREIYGAFGKGSISKPTYELAKNWIDFKNGWGKFTASKKLTSSTVTWLSIWKNGELIVAQTRERLYWELGNRSPSGVTGITGAGITKSDKQVTKTAMDSIFSIDSIPTGIFGVDMTYDEKGIPNPTEINIGRFFTTHLFFTEAGLNLPYIYTKIAYGEEIPKIEKKIDPLPENLCWIRGVDFNPILTKLNEVELAAKKLDERRLRLHEK